MAILADQHLHSSFSGDSDAKMEDMIRSGLARGLKFMTFTEHMDYEFPNEKYNLAPGFFEVNADSYLYELLSNRAKYEDECKIIFGVELGLKPEAARRNNLFLKQHEYDFVIGSVHLVEDVDPYYPEYFEGRTERAAMEAYFNCILDNMKAYMGFDVLGHMDYIVRYTPSKGAEYSPADYTDQIDRILQKLIDNEKGLEVNTGAFVRGLDFPNPHMDILKRYRELGGEVITIGSDAHKPEDVGVAFDRTAEILKSLGYRHYCIFENRLPEYKVI